MKKSENEVAWWRRLVWNLLMQVAYVDGYTAEPLAHSLARRLAYLHDELTATLRALSETRAE